MEALSFRLEAFEGPLDLLLQLISKNKINIYDIPIAEILEQYLASIEGIRELDMEQASEFLTMAAYLMMIKSQMLLPRHEEEEEDPRENLVRMLLEYQRYKSAAQQLGERLAQAPFRLVRQPLALGEPAEEPYAGRHVGTELLLAYLSAVSQAQRRLPPPITQFKGIVNTTYTSISTRVVSILRRLLRGQEMTLQDAFAGSTSRSDVVATFLAVLELMSKMRVRVEGEGGNARVLLRRGEEGESHE